MTVNEVARNFSTVMDGIETDQEEVAVIRDQKVIARLIPEPAELNAIQVLDPLYRTLDDETAIALAEAVEKGREAIRGKAEDLRNPWASS